MNAEPRVIRTKNFVADAAAFILGRARKAMVERNEFRIALSGGNTPVPVYARVAVDAHDFLWDRTRFTFGDERCVPPDDPQSNFRMARENLFVPAGVPEKSIMRMRGEITFTFPLINYARHILFLVGASKSPQLIERVLAGDRQFPAAQVNPVAGEVTWIIGE